MKVSHRIIILIIIQKRTRAAIAERKKETNKQRKKESRILLKLKIHTCLFYHAYFRRVRKFASQDWALVFVCIPSISIRTASLKFEWFQVARFHRLSGHRVFFVFHHVREDGVEVVHRAGFERDDRVVPEREEGERAAMEGELLLDASSFIQSRR